jgi:hypothetical protein
MTIATVSDPMINLILTGSKTMMVEDRTLPYDLATYFVMSLDLPAVGSVHPAETGEPILRSASRWNRRLLQICWPTCPNLLEATSTAPVSRSRR